MLFTEVYAFAYAHHLPTFPEGHKCRGVHGHLNEVTITIEVGQREDATALECAAIQRGDGYAFDHAEIDVVMGDVLRHLDHRLINEVEGIEDGLAESQLAWLVKRLAEAFPRRLGADLVEVHLDEWSSGRNFRLVKHRKSWIREVSK